MEGRQACPTPCRTVVLTGHFQVLGSGSGFLGKKDPNASRHVESGLGLLDNNAVNILMAASMSIGGMLVAGILWDIPISSIFS